MCVYSGEYENNHQSSAFISGCHAVARGKPEIVSAFVKALKYIQTHSAEEIADKMPPEYYAGNKKQYVAALADGKAMFTPDGAMPANGPPTVLSVLSGFDKAVQGKTINLANTFTTEFLRAEK
jgi:NitT/TauT family transport system substrate-binding protein